MEPIGPAEYRIGPQVSFDYDPDAEAWREDALCALMGTEDFFAPSFGTEPLNVRGDETVLTDAKAICRACPVQAHCLGYAIEHEVNYGVYGAMTSSERKDYLREVNRNERKPIHVDPRSYVRA